MPAMRLERVKPVVVSVTDAGPIGWNCVRERGSRPFHTQIRKLAVLVSATGSPRPVPRTGFWRLSDQLLIVPVTVCDLLVISSRQRPGDSLFLSTLSGSRGLYVPKY